MKKILLAILSLGSVTFVNAQCSELFISEYVEGSSHSKAIEIYNPTANPVLLSNYRLIRYSNGSPTPVDSISLTGTIQPYDVWVVVNGQATPDQNGAFCDPALLAMADQVGPPQYVAGTAVLYMNGDDAIALARVAPYAIIDIFGKIGEDPGTAWTDVFPYTSAQGTWWTNDHTLIRKSSVTSGVTANPTAFNVTLEWDSLPENTWTNLGTHSSVCLVGINDIGKNASVVSAYPNPSNGIFTLSASSEIKSTEIYNAVGELVFTNRFATSGKSQQVDLSGQPAGLYFVQVELSNGKRATSKISVR
ncbi:MAG: lamin tail domain-containing protein [Bacteroidota bacterium]|nr:lamin tail domain-containing protein [Bacteroidota bacterium]